MSDSFYKTYSFRMYLDDEFEMSIIQHLDGLNKSRKAEIIRAIIKEGFESYFSSGVVGGGAPQSAKQKKKSQPRKPPAPAPAPAPAPVPVPVLPHGEVAFADGVGSGHYQTGDSSSVLDSPSKSSTVSPHSNVGVNDTTGVSSGSESGVIDGSGGVVRSDNDLGMDRSHQNEVAKTSGFESETSYRDKDVADDNNNNGGIVKADDALPIKQLVESGDDGDDALIDPLSKLGLSYSKGR